MKLTNKEVNIGIADFMQEDFCQCRIYSICPSPSQYHNYCLNENCKKIINNKSYERYTESLDLLVSVWERLIPEAYMEYSINYDGSGYLMDWYDYGDLKLECRSTATDIQEAAAHATYKAIKELNNE